MYETKVKKLSRYNFDKNIHLDLVVSKDEFRKAMQCIIFDNKCAVASEGHILIVAPLTEISNLHDDDIDKLEGKRLNCKNFKILTKYSFITGISDEGITVTNDNTYSVFLKFDECKDKYPNYKSVMDITAKPNMEDEIGINSRMLNDLCYSVGKYKPILKYNGVNKGITIRFSESEIKGLIMPMMINY